MSGDPSFVALPPVIAAVLNPPSVKKWICGLSSSVSLSASASIVSIVSPVVEYKCILESGTVVPTPMFPACVNAIVSVPTALPLGLKNKLLVVASPFIQYFSTPACRNLK